MRIDRVFTRDGVDPYESFEWETRDVKVNRGDGTQLSRRVTVPSGWSQNAAYVMADKYCRRGGVPVATRRVAEAGVPGWLQRSAPDGPEDPEGETDARAVFDRIAGTWAYWGWLDNYFLEEGAANPAEAAENNARAFYDEVRHMMAAQMGAPNTPQWFNTGLAWAYGIEGCGEGYWHAEYAVPGQSGDYAVKASEDGYKHPATSACFIIPVKDSLVGNGGIMDLWSREARIFKFGSGSGCNPSEIRGKGEGLSGGGCASGLLSFLKIGDRAAGSIKSGGTCLAPQTRVYTELGPVPVVELARSAERFACLSYDPAAGRYKVKWARAWKSGRKPVVAVVTDKGRFEVSYDHPMRLADGRYVEAGLLTAGVRLFACHVHDRGGYLRVGLRTGKRGGGSRYLHRMIAEDLLGADRGQVVDHADDDKRNNRIGNLEVKTQAEHAGRHGRDLAAAGDHVFQKHCFAKWGSDNPMSSGSAFWQDQAKSAGYRARKRAEIAGRSSSMQVAAARQKMLNLGWELINAGYDISTFESYTDARLDHRGKFPVAKCKRAIEARFGSYPGFLRSINESNHRVVAVEVIGEMDVYDVQVDCASPDARTADSGHNFVIWPGDSPTGSGVAVHNTRRAAKIIVLDDDHPDLEEFITWKVVEENKVAALVAGTAVVARHVTAMTAAWGKADMVSFGAAVDGALEDGVPVGYLDRVVRQLRLGKTPEPPVAMNTDWQGEAYETVTGQNANNSVGASNAFMRAARERAPWNLYGRVEKRQAKAAGREPKPRKTVNAGALWDSICESAWKCADPGLFFDTTVNEWNTVPNDGRIKGPNPCFTGDSRIMTTRGLMMIRDLVIAGHGGEMIPVLRRDGTPSVPSQLMVTGVNRILRVTLSDGRVLRTTDYHTWIVNGGVEKEAKDLVPGDVVGVASESSFTWDGVRQLPTGDVVRRKGERALPVIPKVWDESLAEITGHLIGDGCVTAERSVVLIYGREESENRQLADKHLGALRVLFGIEPGDCAMSNGCRQVRVTRKAVGRFFEAIGVKVTGSESKAVPESVFTAPPKIVAAFLRGYFGADGTCTGRAAQGECDVSVTSVSVGLLRGVQMLLDLFQIRSSIQSDGRAGQTVFGDYIRKEGYRLRLHTADLDRFAARIGFSAETKQSRLLAQLARNVKAREWPVAVAAVEADGEELTFNLTEPIEHCVWANGVYIRQCGEFCFLDDTACNLAAANLAKFYDPATGQFDVASFRHACRLWVIALDLTVGRSQYPSEGLVKGTQTYRTVGLGYANLGGMLMMMGVPYDSDEGRATCAAVTCLMHAVAYETSAELAGELGTFPAFARNREEMMRVVRNHREAARPGTGLRRFDGLSVEPWQPSWSKARVGLVRAAREAADRMVEAGEKNGFRNAQVTLLMPTGTVGILMDCATTGIEPDFALVKRKELAGGGEMMITNCMVVPGLSALGYTPEQVTAIREYVTGRRTTQGCPHYEEIFGPLTPDERIEAERLARGAWHVRRALPEAKQKHLDGLNPAKLDEANRYVCGTMTVEGAPYLKAEHYAVFDCANKCGMYGKRFLSGEAHVRMMAAAQPFLSGAISKTINLPEDATPADMGRLMFLAWELMCKDVAVYREGSKLSQPLNASPVRDLAARAPRADPDARPVPVRRVLPDRRFGFTQKSRVGRQKIYCRSGEYEDGTLGEIFLDIHQPGTFTEAIAKAFAIAVSLGLQFGVPLEEYVEAFARMKFEPAGPVTGNPHVKYASSILDCVFRDLAVTYLNREDMASDYDPDRQPAAEAQPEKPKRKRRDGSRPEPAVKAASGSFSPREVARFHGYEGDPCQNCGHMTLIRNGACLKCDTCKLTSGCSG